MSNKAIHLFFLFSTFLCFQTCSHRFQAGVDPNGNAMFTDHLFLAMQWKRGRSTEFTIHGLWPGDSQKLTSPPEFCNRSNHLSYLAIQPLRNDLHLYWPTLINHGRDFVFWSTEWYKHGTCSGLSQYEYFKLALDLAMPLHLRLRLQSSNVNPRNSYPPYSFIHPILTTYGVTPSMVCNRYQGLREFRFNYTNDYPNIKEQNVDASLIYMGCTRGPYVRYP